MDGWISEAEISYDALKERCYAGDECICLREREREQSREQELIVKLKRD